MNVSVREDSRIPIGSGLIHMGFVNTKWSPLTAPFIVSIDPDSIDEIHLLADNSIRFCIHTE